MICRELLGVAVSEEISFGGLLREINSFRKSGFVRAIQNQACGSQGFSMCPVKRAIKLRGGSQ